MVYTKPFTIARNALGCVETLSKRGDTLRTYTLAPLLAATLLAGCSSTTLIDAPSVPTNAPPSDASGQKAFVFESGTVPIGDFDPFALAPEDYFDPCNDITEDEFRRAGFTGEIKRSTDGEIDSPHGNSFCMFSEPGTFQSKGIANSDGNRSQAEQTRVMVDGIESNILPEIYVYRQEMPLVTTHPCIAQVDTMRGAIGTFFFSLDESYSFDDYCQIAVDLLEQLYLSGAHS